MAVFAPLPPAGFKWKKLKSPFVQSRWGGQGMFGRPIS